MYLRQNLTKLVTDQKSSISRKENKTVFQSSADIRRPVCVVSYASMTLTLTSLTLVLKRDPDILKMYLRPNNEVCEWMQLKVRAQTDRHIRFVALWPWPWPDDLDTQLDLAIWKIHLRSKKNVSGSLLSKVTGQTDASERITRPHWRVIILVWRVWCSCAWRVCIEWHLATQVLYFVAAFMILFSELYARIQMCCSDERNHRNYAIIGIIVLISGNFALLCTKHFTHHASGWQPPGRFFSSGGWTYPWSHRQARLNSTQALWILIWPVELRGESGRAMWLTP